MTISEATTNEQRQQVADLFLSVFSDIHPRPVPMLDADAIYAPVVARYDAPDGRLVGAALTCRAQIAAAMTMAARLGRATHYTAVQDKHSELDLLAVVPDRRSEGIGSELVAYLESRLRARRVRAWFGNVTPNLDVASLRRFYASHGFTVTEPGEGLPPLLGREWVMPGTKPPAFYFYKMLRGTA